MRDFAHHEARSIGEATSLLAAYRGKARLNAGGTDLLSVLKGDLFETYPEAIINIKTIEDLDYLRRDATGLRIGALTALSTLSVSPTVADGFSILAEASRSVASPQIRNVATVGGNLCQDVRCWYYRYPRGVGGPMDCARKGKGPCLAIKGDNRYHAILGGKRCFAVCPSDIAVALAALDAKIIVTGSGGEREVSPVDFYSPMGNALRPDEMVREVGIPLQEAGGRHSFLKFTLRKPIDFAIVSVASIIVVDKAGVCTDARIALGGVAPGPFRTKDAEKVLVGSRLTGDLASAAAETALADARPLSKNAYKIRIARTLVKRAITRKGPA